MEDGDDQEFWGAVAERLRRFIRGRVDDVHVADDLTHDVILRAQAGLESAPVENLSAWLFQIARNVVIDHYRARSIRQTSSLEDTHHLDETESAVITELSGCIRPMLARLPAEYREALEKTDLGESTQAELAQDLGMSVSGIKSRVQRAREQLKTVLMKCCEPRIDSSGRVTEHDCECQPPDYCSEKSGKC